MTISIAVDPAVLVAALVAAGYTVTAAAPAPTNALKVVIAQNGTTPNWQQDYSYAASDVRNATGGNGNQYCIEVTTKAAWGGFQPSNLNGKVTDFSQCTTLTVDVNAPKGESFSMQFLRGGDVNIAGTKNNHFTKTRDGWETFTFAKGDLMTDTVLGDVSAQIYKGAIESQNPQTVIVFGVDNWGGL